MTAKKKHTREYLKHRRIAKQLHERSRKEKRQHKHVLASAGYTLPQVKITPKVWGEYAFKQMEVAD